GIEVDGNDVAAVHAAAGSAVRRARVGHGPTLLECKTYRTRPHAEGMGDFTYRTRDEVESWKQRWPIRRLRSELIAEGTATATELDRIDAEVQNEVEESYRRAEQSQWPEASQAATFVFATPRRPEPSPPPDSKRSISYSQATLEAL